VVNELLCHLRLVTPDTSAGPAYPPEAGALCVWAPVGVRIRSGPGMTACGTCHTGKEVLRIASHSSARSVRCPHVSIPATFGRGDGQISWLVLGAPPRRSHGLSRGVPGTGGMWTGTVGTGSEAVGQGAVTVGMGAVTVGVGSSAPCRGNAVPYPLTPPQTSSSENRPEVFGRRVSCRLRRDPAPQTTSYLTRPLLLTGQ